LNDVMIAISNLERSTAFYENLFGAPVRQGDAVVEGDQAGLRVKMRSNRARRAALRCGSDAGDRL
jgi:catechol 2,3-dioxygenase-like lactoylglutathione lyase family enzyme